MGVLFSKRRKRRLPGWALALLFAVAVVLPSTAAQTATSKTASSTPADAASDATVEQLFADFLHYARMGEFIRADAYAKALLAHPDLDPVTVMELANRDRKSLETLHTIIKNAKNPSFVDSATRVMELIEKGEFLRRQDVERIQANILQLGGNPQQEAMAIAHLAAAGEYAVPLLVKTLLNPNQAAMRTRVLSALPKIGKEAVNPLVAALGVESNDIRQDLIKALGDIGYPQAIPYLRKVVAGGNAFPETKAAATAAIARIEARSGRSFPEPGDVSFYELAERFYNEDESVRADPRLDESNVWYWDSAAAALKPVVVPRRIFGPVMAMRCCEEAILLRHGYADAISLWLAANIRREHRLGLNVESRDLTEAGLADRTRPTVFPRALYFTQAAGPKLVHKVLSRAVQDRDSAVALGAIAALRVTAGEASLVGPEDEKQPLAQCLRFPDSVVRIKAALALGAAVPKTQFADAQFVVPMLAQTLAQSGRQQAVVVDANPQNANRVMAVLRANDRDVIAETSFFRAMERARLEFQGVSAVFLSTDIAEPGVSEAVNQLRSEFAFSKTSIVILRKPTQSVVADEIAGRDELVETVDASAADAALEAALERGRGRAGQTPLQPEMALDLALQAAETLRRIAVDGRTVYDGNAATPALIAALSAPEEKLQVAAASVLALSPSPAAQRAVAHLALDEKNTKTLRMATFGSLAESAKTNGNQLEDAQITTLTKIAKDDADLDIRTAASQTLGAINLNKASEIIRAFYGG